jgi:hypothetical protein
MVVTEISQSALTAALPRLHSQEGVADPIVHLKFVCDSGWTWLVTEGSPDGEDFVFFGFVIGQEEEWGEFLLSELVGSDLEDLPISQDPSFVPQPLSKVLSDRKSRVE